MDDFNNENNGGVNLTKEPEPQDTGNQGESNAQQNFGGIPEQPVQQQPNPPIQQPFNNPNMGNMGGYNPNPNMNPNMNQNPNQPQPGQGLAIASLVCGIVSIIGFCCCIPVGIICGIAAIVCGVISRVKNMNGAGMAIAGIVTGAVGFVGTVIWAIIGGAMRDNFADMLEEAMESVCLFMFI